MGAHFAIKPGMVSACFNTISPQYLRYIIGSFAVYYINNARFSRPLLNKLHHILNGQLRALLRPYLIIQVMPVKRRNKNVGFYQLQRFNNIALHLWRCRCRKGYQRKFLVKRLNNFVYTTVFGPEIVPPL